MENFWRFWIEKEPAYTYVEKFPRPTCEKLKANVFIGPRIRHLFNDRQFEAVLSDKENAAWQNFVKVSKCFLGNFMGANFKELVQGLMDSYEQLRFNM